MSTNREQLLMKAYNLILDPTVSQDERDSLVAFKTDLEQGSDDSRSVMKLAESLRQLSVRGLKNGEKLSPNVATFYREIAYDGEKKSNLARGLMSIGMWGLGK
ncbi:bacteriocin immunity protein [Streptococcus pluranimalium]|uniref:bacteriocin immunity protein n=1 Tax=Streptococcus pluranimalium TaxID=82348 RepID=UPI0024157284|nr:bacteriocin immunity protein [Streptococcus pluranimalium]MDY3042527.1 bacteriocin immunity protein [Streptococcus pluranimalium]WFM79274.1 bacteriocin immunity protein [Streptococcus pluranimalium]HEM6117109.1 bacteriocin immunity protein [Streptococcus suis]